MAHNRRTEALQQWKDMGRPIGCPEITTLDQVFSGIRPSDFAHGRESRVLGYVTSDFDNDKMGIGSHLSVSDQRGDDLGLLSFHVKSIHDGPLEYLKHNLLAINHDRTHFKLVIYKDGTALLVCQYGSIIGSRYVAFLDNVDIYDAWASENKY